MISIRPSLLLAAFAGVVLALAAVPGISALRGKAPQWLRAQPWLPPLLTLARAGLPLWPVLALDSLPPLGDIAQANALATASGFELGKLPDPAWAAASLLLTSLLLFVLHRAQARTTLARWARYDSEEERISSLRDQMSARWQRGGDGYSVSTAMPDRAALVHWLDQTMTHARLAGSGCAVLLIHLADACDTFNDAAGDAVPHVRADDSLAQEAGALARAVLEPNDLLARLAQDLFAVGVPGLLDQARAQELGTRLVTAFTERMAARGLPLQIGVSIGIAVCPYDAQTPEGLLRAARISLGEARESGANQVRVFSAAAGERARRMQMIRRDLWRAIQDGSLSLHFQPKYDVRQRVLVGAEALCRWRHPALGTVDPAEFIPVAEQSGRIDGLDDWVIASVCRQVREWMDEGLPQLPVAINVSGLRFASGGFPAYLLDQIHHHDIPPSAITLEITETAAMRDIDRSVQALAELQSLGIQVALDDFGSGYSSLGYLKRLRVNTLKIDRTLIAGLDGDEQGRAIVASTVALAHELRMQVVAEGVETDGQLDILARLGCDMAQGFLLSPPMDVPAFSRLLAGTAVVCG